MTSKIRSIKREQKRSAAKDAEEQIEVTYAQLADANLSGALSALFNQRMPGRLMQFVKLGRAVKAEMDSLDEAKTKLIEQHGGKLDEETGAYKFAKGKQEAADRDYKELLQTTVKITAPRLRENELEQSSLTAAQILNLLWLIEEN
jgi:hypothetical protein